MKKRLDDLLLEKNLVESRSQARALILAGQVSVDGTKVEKAGTRIETALPIQIRDLPRFVSRGGEKLEAALKNFRISTEGRICLDVGSSTGGFTDCLLKLGATKVYAVDVGWGQLHPRLKADPRVEAMERTHILRLEPRRLPERPSLACIDVSFISLRKVIGAVSALLEPGGEIVALFKPQFEVGPKNLKKGIVKEEAVSRQARDEFEEWAKNNSFQTIGWKPSVLRGAKGNQEYFTLLVTKASF